MFAGACITNKDPFQNLMNVGFGAFLTGYKNTWSAAQDLKMLNILSVSSLYLFWDNCTFGTFCRKCNLVTRDQLMEP